jgi:hypothetical protein
MKEYPFVICGYECDEGWYSIIEECFDKIQELELPEGFEVIQVKEKFGTLRVYTICSSEEIEKLIDNAYDKALFSCEVCGKPGKNRTKYHWMKTTCEECFNKW